MAALKNIDIVNTYLEKGKKATSEWLYEEAKSQKIPLADPRSFLNLTNRIYEKHRHLQKSMKTSKGAVLYQAFCDENLVFPKPAVTFKKRKSETSSTDNVKRLQGEAEVLKDVASSIAQDLHKSQSEKSELLTELVETKKKQSAKVIKGKSANTLKNELKTLKTENKQFAKTNRQLRRQLKKQI